VQEIANSLCDLQYCVRWLRGLCVMVMLSAAMCRCPAVAAWCGGLLLDGGEAGRGEGRERVCAAL
jgi:hypothetical protein